MLVLNHDSVLSLLTLIAQPFLERSSQVSWDRWDRTDFSPQSPSERTDWQTQNAVFFLGGKKRSMKADREGGEGPLPKSKRGEHIDV